jgi:hypothetical protein
MTKLLYMALSLVAFTCLLMGGALADVAPGPIIATVVGIPLIAIAVVILAAVLIVRLIRNNRRK